MHRREFLSLSLAGVSASAMADHRRVHSIDEGLRWLDQLEAAPGVHTTGKWPLAVVLSHLSQCIEMSMDGYPQPKHGLYQSTAGTALFTYLMLKGRMDHNLDEPIPGASPADPSQDWRKVAERLRRAMGRFISFNGTLMPHFQFGPLSKAEFTTLHHLHLANHRQEIALVG